MRTLPIPIRLPGTACPIARHNPTEPAPDQRPQRRETRRRNRDPRLHGTVPRNQHPLLIQRLPPHAHVGHDAQHAGGRAHRPKAQQCRRPDLVPLGHGGAPDELDAEGGVDDVDEGVGYGPRDGDDVGRGEERAGAVGFFEEGDAAGWGEGEEDEAEEGGEDGQGQDGVALPAGGGLREDGEHEEREGGLAENGAEDVHGVEGGEELLD